MNRGTFWSLATATLVNVARTRGGITPTSNLPLTDSPDRILVEPHHVHICMGSTTPEAQQKNFLVHPLGNILGIGFGYGERQLWCSPYFILKSIQDYTYVINQENRMYIGFVLPDV